MTNVIIWDTELNQRPLTHGADAADGDQQQSHSQADSLHNSADDDSEDDDYLLSLFQLNHRHPYKRSQSGCESSMTRIFQAKLQWCDQITEFPLDARQMSEL